MLTMFFLRLVDHVKDIVWAVRSFGAPKSQLIPIRIRIESYQQRRPTRR